MTVEVKQYEYTTESNILRILYNGMHLTFITIH